MKKVMLSLALSGVIAVGAAAPMAQAAPGGCLKYGAAGAVAGHMAGHGVRGAAFGCAVGMYRRHLYNKQQRQMRNNEVQPGQGT